MKVKGSQIIMSIPLTLLGLLAVFEIKEYFLPPSDDEIVRLGVEAWDGYAFFTTVIGVAVASLTVIMLGVAYLSHHRGRRVALIGAAVGMLIIGLALMNHILLTCRVTRLTGQTFGGFYGLW